MSAVTEKVHNYFSQFPRREYPKGQILIFADEDPEHLFYIVEGRVRKYDVSYRGEEVIINVYQNPAIFPISWALNHTPNRYFYKTETPVVLHVIPAESVVQYLERNPDVTIDLVKRIYQGLEGLYGRMVHLMSGSAGSRLVYELLIECRRFGEKLPDGSNLLHTNEVDLAARSGLSRETVSREMQKLKAKDWVTVGKNAITIHDVDTLQKSLGGGV